MSEIKIPEMEIKRYHIHELVQSEKPSDVTKLKQLISQPNVDLDQYNCDLLTPLHIAVEHNNHESVRLLLESGRVWVDKPRQWKGGWSSGAKYRAFDILVTSRWSNIRTVNIVMLLLKHGAYCEFDFDEDCIRNNPVMRRLAFLLTITIPKSVPRIGRLSSLNVLPIEILRSLDKYLTYEELPSKEDEKEEEVKWWFADDDDDDDDSDDDDDDY